MKLETTCRWQTWLLGVSWGELSPGLNLNYFAMNIGPFCILMEWERTAV